MRIRKALTVRDDHYRDYKTIYLSTSVLLLVHTEDRERERRPTERIPAMTTGTQNLTIISGLKMDDDAMPILDLAIP
jgi:hypothetical protein